MKILRTILCAGLLALCTTAFAQSCKVVVPYAAGGAGDEFARAMQEANPAIDMVQFRPGAFASHAISFLRENPEYVLAAAPLMWTSKNPDKNPPVELLNVILLYGQTGVTGRNVTFNDILTKDVTVAIPNVGGSQHLIALELQKVNPKIVIVPVAGAAAGTQLVVNKEVDMYITPAKTGHGMVRDFGAKLVFEIPHDKKEIKIQGVTLTNYGMFAVFSHTSATPAQKAAQRECVRQVMESPKFGAALAKLRAAPIQMTKSGEEAYIREYLTELDRNGF